MVIGVQGALWGLGVGLTTEHSDSAEVLYALPNRLASIRQLWHVMVNLLEIHSRMSHLIAVPAITGALFYLIVLYVTPTRIAIAFLSFLWGLRIIILWQKRGYLQTSATSS